MPEFCYKGELPIHASDRVNGQNPQQSRRVDENTREIKRTNTKVDPKPRTLIAKLNKKVDHREETGKSNL